MALNPILTGEAVKTMAGRRSNSFQPASEETGSSIMLAMTVYRSSKARLAGALSGRERQVVVILSAMEAQSITSSAAVRRSWSACGSAAASCRMAVRLAVEAAADVVFGLARQPKAWWAVRLATAEKHSEQRTRPRLARSVPDTDVTPALPWEVLT